MPDKTLNHEYDAPDKGTPRWNVPLNSNFIDLDTDVEIRDEEANRHEYEPKVDAKFFSTDTGTIYVGDGANWNSISVSSAQNADTLDGLNSSQFLRSDTDDSFSGTLSDGAGNVVYDQTNNWIPQTRLENDTVTVAGNAVSLGGSTAIAHADLSAITSSDHHTRYSDEEAHDAVNTLLSGGTNVSLTYDDVNNTLTVDSPRPSISNGGTQVLANVGDVNFGSQFSVVDDTDGTVTTTLNQGDGSGLSADLWDGRELYVQSTAPSSPNSGDIWIDTSN